MSRQLWDDGDATSVADLNLAMSQVVRRYRTTVEADADNPEPVKGQVRILTGYDLPTRIRPDSDFNLQHYDGSNWLYDVLGARVVPFPPTLTATVLSTSSIRINWTPATVDANPATGWEVLVGTTWTPLPLSTTTYTFTGLAASTRHHLYVRARNAAGVSEPVGVLSTTLTPVTPPPPVLRRPNAPTLSVVISGDRLTLRWHPAAGPAATYWKVWGIDADAANVALPLTLSASARTWRSPRLNNRDAATRSFSVQVVGGNADGDGTATALTSATIMPPPVINAYQRQAGFLGLERYLVYVANRSGSADNYYFSYSLPGETTRTVPRPIPSAAGRNNNERRLPLSTGGWALKNRNYFLQTGSEWFLSSGVALSAPTLPVGGIGL